MTDNIEESPGYSYVSFILSKWYSVCSLSEELRNYLATAPDGAQPDVATEETFNKYKSMMTRLWIELYPKVNGNETVIGKPLHDKFVNMRKHTFSPKKMTMVEAFEMEESTALILDKLKITDIKYIVGGD
jgi:hypothetical protein